MIKVYEWKHGDKVTVVIYNLWTTEGKWEQIYSAPWTAITANLSSIQRYLLIVFLFKYVGNVGLFSFFRRVVCGLGRVKACWWSTHVSNISRLFFNWRMILLNDAWENMVARSVKSAFYILFKWKKQWEAGGNTVRKEKQYGLQDLPLCFCQHSLSHKRKYIMIRHQIRLAQENWRVASLSSPLYSWIHFFQKRSKATGKHIVQHKVCAVKKKKKRSSVTPQLSQIM